MVFGLAMANASFLGAMDHSSSGSSGDTGWMASMASSFSRGPPTF